MYGILMCLPQTSAFITLKIRLECLNGLYILYDTSKPLVTGTIDAGKLDSFLDIQKRHMHFKLTNSIAMRKKNAT